MVRNGEFSSTDIKRVLRKHWWILPVFILGCGAASIFVANQLPKEYTSKTMVLVAKPAVPEEYVKPVVTEDLTERLASMKEQILSRTRLEPVIEKFNLYASDHGKLHMEDLVERLRKAVVISPLEAMPGTQGGLPGFSVNVSFNNPQLAQQICTEITSMFMEQNARSLEQQASRTTSFIGEKLGDAKAKLDEQDAKLAQFKRQYIGALPEETQSNLGLVSTLNAQLDANTQAMARAQQDKTLNESLLAQQETTWKASQTEQNPETLQDQLKNRQEQLTVLLSRYTPEHPDVVKLQNEIAELRKKIEETPAADDPSLRRKSATEPSQIQQLRSRIQQDDLNYADLQKRQQKIQDSIRLVESHIEASPMVELQLKELTRSYQSALDFYNELLKKQDNSEMARDLVHQQQGEQFRVLDPPSLPSSPSFPKMLNFAAGGFGGGAAIALALLYLLMAFDNTLHTEREVETHLKLAVLTSLPILESAGARLAFLKRS